MVMQAEMAVINGRQAQVIRRTPGSIQIKYLDTDEVRNLPDHVLPSPTYEEETELSLPPQHQERIDLQTGEITRSWEELCDEGRAAADDIHNGYWRLGDIARQVNKAYGADAIGEFAKAIGQPKARVREYRRVAAYWDENSERSSFLEEFPQVPFSIYREAMRLKDKQKAADFIVDAATNEWSVEKAALVVDKELGKPVPREQVFAAVGNVDSITSSESFVWVTVKYPNTPETIRLSGKHQDDEARVTIYLPVAESKDADNDPEI